MTVVCPVCYICLLDDFQLHLQRTGTADLIRGHLQGHVRFPQVAVSESLSPVEKQSKANISLNAHACSDTIFTGGSSTVD